MSKNVNVFIGVLLCAVLCGTFVWLSGSGDESSWSPGDIYNEVQGAGSVGGSSTTSATFSSPSNEGGLALPISSSSRARYSNKYAGAYSGASYAPLASSPLASSPLTYGAAPGAGLYTTSSAEIKSFGGGGNGGAAMGGAMRGSSSPNSLIASSPITSISSPIAYSTARRGSMSSGAGDNLAMMAAENPVASVASATMGMSNGFYGGYSAMDYSSAADYGQYTGMFGGGSRSNVRGRQNVGSIEENYLGWLSSGLWKYGDGYDGITMEELRALYVAATGDTDFSNQAEWDAFLDWFNMKQSDGTFGWYWAPISDAIPFLLLLCAIWALVVYRRTKSQTVPCEEVEK